MKRNEKDLRYAVYLCAALLFTACGGQSIPQDETDQMIETVESAAADDRSFSEQLQERDFGGETFRILTSNTLIGMELPTTINYAAETSGEPVNDAIYARDRWLEETFHVQAVYTLDEAMPLHQLTSGILAGDGAFDLLIADHATYTYGLASAGAIYPLNHVPSLQLKEAYWMPELNEQLRICDQLIYVSSAISPRFYGSVYLIMFNRDLARTLGVDDYYEYDFYEMVENGTWTMEIFKKFSRIAGADINGDSRIDNDDRFGMQYEVLTPEALAIGMGFHYVKNEGGTLEVMLEHPLLVDQLQGLASFLAEDCVGQDIWSNYADNKPFMSGNLLFHNPCTFNLAGFRDLPYDYGILPMPKLDEAQKEYISYSQPWASAGPCIPISLEGDRLEMVGTLTNALAAYGYDHIRPAVFEDVIQLKGTRDARSAEIVDMIFENITFELSSILRFGSFNDMMHRFFTTDLGKKDIVSSYAAIKDATLKEIEKIQAAYAELGEKVGG